MGASAKPAIMTDKRGYRPTIKLRLSDKWEAIEAQQIIAAWAKDRRAAQNITDAVRLYDALENGDTSVLLRLFPDLALQVGGQPSAGYTPPKRRKGKDKRGDVVLHEPTEEESIDDLLDLF